MPSSDSESAAFAAFAALAALRRAACELARIRSEASVGMGTASKATPVTLQQRLSKSLSRTYCLGSAKSRSSSSIAEQKYTAGNTPHDRACSDESKH